MFRMPPGSRTHASQIHAAKNPFSLFEVVEGRLNLSNSTFSGASGREAGDNADSCMKLTDANVSIKECDFQRNGGDDGAAIKATGSRIIVAKSTFEKNIARKRGILSVRDGGSLEIHSCHFISNRAGESGGAIDARKTHIVITKSTFRNNEAGLVASARRPSSGQHLIERDAREETSPSSSYGGAAYFDRVTGEIEDCEFQSNKARNDGGGIYVEESTMDIVGGNVDNNRASNGGGVYVRRSRVVISEGDFKGNNASEEGGGIKVYEGSDVTIKQTSFKANRAGDEGGGIIAGKSYVRVMGATFEGNIAKDEGGRISADFGTELHVHQSLFKKNHAGDGGAVEHGEKSAGYFSSVTFEENTALGYGGSVAAEYAKLSFIDSAFRNGAAGLGGSFISLSENCDVHIESTSMTRGSAKRGGAIDVLTSVLKARGLDVSNCSAETHGGALMSTYSAIVCVDCSLQKNSARETGGGISFEAGEKDKNLVLQLEGTSVSRNTAKVGGEFSLQWQQVGDRCIISL